MIRSIDGSDKSNKTGASSAPACFGLGCNGANSASNLRVSRWGASKRQTKLASPGMKPSGDSAATSDGAVQRKQDRTTQERTIRKFERTCPMRHSFEQGTRE